MQCAYCEDQVQPEDEVTCWVCPGHVHESCAHTVITEHLAAVWYGWDGGSPEEYIERYICPDCNEEPEEPDWDALALERELARAG